MRPSLALSLILLLSGCASKPTEPTRYDVHAIGSCDPGDAGMDAEASAEASTDASEAGDEAMAADAAADASIDASTDASESGGPLGCEGGVDAGLGATGAWTQVTLPGWATGDDCQSIVVDPVNPGSIVTACGNNDGRHIKWYRSTDFGNAWALRNSTTMSGNPWGFSGDPNPSRDPCSPQTIYSPAGYGSYGAWKSVDGALTWTRLPGADTAFAPVSPYGSTDLYHVETLPDDPPNHVLASYHYFFKGDAGSNLADGGFGESWDGGATWVIHYPPAGIGTSHYIVPISGTTWVVVAQSNSSANGMWRTTTAGRVGGTAAFDYRDGVVSPSAWANVSPIEHTHGSYGSAHVGSAWYSSGLVNSTTGSIWKSIDDGNSWTDLQPGYYWASPPNPAYSGKSVTGLAATPTYLYANYFIGPAIARAPVASDTAWLRNYVSTPSGLNNNGSNPLGSAGTVQAGHGVVFMATNVGVWRFIEP